jgi:hypothetical protein
MMMVIPTSNHVELYYGGTWANTVGQTLEVIAWALLLGITTWTVVVLVRRKRQPAPEGPDDSLVAPPALPSSHDECSSEEWDIPDFEDDSPLR